MSRIIAITNQKGGVGKTTTAINLCASLSRAGNRLLLVDLDPQGNATVGSGVAMRELERGTYEVLLGECGMREAIVSTDSGYDILPSHPDLAGAQVEMAELERRDFRLADAMREVTDVYGLILIDCPPALNVLTVNALTAAREVLIPVQCEYYAAGGTHQPHGNGFAGAQTDSPPGLEVLGLVRTMFDTRNSLSSEVAAQLEAHFPQKLFRTVIPRNVRLAEAPSYGKPVLDYDRHCAGSQGLPGAGERGTAAARATHPGKFSGDPVMNSKKKARLGRGLGALLGEVSEAPVGDETGAVAASDSQLRNLPIDLLNRGKYQPRVKMDREALEELAESIRVQGVVQPLLVRRTADGEYEIVAGERRWRAAQIAGLAEVPAVVREISDQNAMAVALIENIQREDLNSIEEARGFQRLQDEFGLTHQDIADAVGRSRAAVSNLLRLLTLHPAVQKQVEDGALEMGHARALLGLLTEAQPRAAATVVARGLSVRDAEKLVKKLLRGARTGATGGRRRRRPARRGAVCATGRQGDDPARPQERQGGDSLPFPRRTGRYSRANSLIIRQPRAYRHRNPAPGTGPDAALHNGFPGAVAEGP